MLDELDGRIWAAHHAQFADTVGRAFAGLRARIARALAPIDLVFRELARIQFGAPWQPRKHRCRG